MSINQKNLFIKWRGWIITSVVLGGSLGLSLPIFHIMIPKMTMIVWVTSVSILSVGFVLAVWNIVLERSQENRDDNLVQG